MCSSNPLWVILFVLCFSESETVRLDLACKPAQPTDLAAVITQKLTDAHVYVNISWTDSSPCKPVQFTLVIWEPDGTLVMQNTKETHVLIEWKDICQPIPVDLTGFHERIRGETRVQSMSLITEPSAPRQLTGIIAERITDVSAYVRLSWTTFFPCQPLKYHLAYRSPDGTKVQKNTTNKNMVIHWEKICEPIPVELTIMYEEIGGRPLRGNVTLTSAPKPPVAIAIDKFQKPKEYSVSWRDESECQANRYTVSLYNEKGESYEELTSDRPNIQIPVTNQCKHMDIGIAGWNVAGKGEESTRTPLHHPPAPTPPDTIEIKQIDNRYEYDISWTDASECKATRYVLRLEDVREVSIEELETNVPKLRIGIHNPCQVVYAIITGWSSSGESRASKLFDLHVPPPPITTTELGIQMHREIGKVTFSWTDKSICVALVYVGEIRGGTEVQKFSTHRLEHTISSLEPCTNYNMLVYGVSMFGQGGNSEKIHFYIPRNFEAPVVMNIAISNDGANIYMFWKANGACPQTKYNVELQNLYNRTQSVLFNTTESEIIVPKPKCYSSTLEVKMISDWWIGDVYSTGRIKEIQEPEMLINLTATITDYKTDTYVFVNLSWTDVATCRQVIYEISYVALNGTALAEKTNNPYVLIEWTDICFPIEVELTPVYQDFRGYTLRQTINLTGAPLKIEGLSVEPEAYQNEVQVSWKYTEPCHPTQFSVVLYNTDGGTLMTQLSMEKEIVLRSLPTCVTVYVSVTANNEIGPGPSSEKLSFVLYADPKLPANLTAIITEYITESYVLVNLSWTDRSICQPEAYEISYEVPDGTILFEKTSKTHLVIHWADICHRILVNLTPVNNKFQGPTLHGNLSLLAAPLKIDGLSVQPEEDRNNVFVSWNYSDPCRQTQYSVVIHNTEGATLLTQLTMEKELVVQGLPTCVALYVSVNAQNEIGLGPMSEKLGFKINAEPAIPANLIAIITEYITESYVLVNLSWIDRSICQPEAYEISYAAPDGFVLLDNTTKPHLVIYWADVCHPILVNLTAVNKNLRGPTLNRNLSLLAGSSKIEGLSVQAEANHNGVHVSWDYSDPCRQTQFSVVIYNTEGDILLAQLTIQKDVVLQSLPTCETLYVSVTAKNETGAGPSSANLAFIIDAEPVIPANLTAIITEYITDAYVLVNLSWTDRSICQPKAYEISYAAPDGTVLLEKPSKPQLIIHWEDICHPILMNLTAVTKNLRGPTLHQNISLLASSSNIEGLSVEFETNQHEVHVSWEYSDPCRQTQFSVVIYNTEGDILLTQLTMKTEVVLRSLPTCVTLYVSVTAQNEIVVGPISEKLGFKIDAEAAINSSDIRLNVNHNRTQLDVSWPNTSQCGLGQLRVNLYNERELVQSKITTENHITFNIDNQGETYHVGLLSNTTGGNEIEVISEQYNVPMPERPSAPQDLSVQVIPEKQIATAAWRHNNATNFTLSVYKGSNVIRYELTSKTRANISKLPMDVPLYLGVIANGLREKSDETRSRVFYFPSGRLRPVQSKTVNKRMEPLFMLYRMFQEMVRLALDNMHFP